MLKVLKIFLILFCGIFLANCNQQTDNNESIGYQRISGETMGTTYHITFESNLKQRIKHQIDSILIAVNDAVSTYVDSSIITGINQSTHTIKSNLISDTLENHVIFENISNEHFVLNFQISQHFYENTEGYFDPTVMPLVNYWGFGYKPKQAVTEIDVNKISEILPYVGFDQWRIEESEDGQYLIHKPINAELDFSAVAKGYGVDAIAKYLESVGSENYLVEIGGEVYARGVNQKQATWTIGLNTPIEEAGINAFEALVQIDQKGLATSGNYRNFYEVDGRKYGHEINPKTGMPEINELLGVSVIANTCAEADAYATAFMVMGLQKSQKLVEEIENIEAIFFYGDDHGGIARSTSSSFDLYLKKD